jgi:L-methionine (R)-S-oxide reductase
VVIPMITSEGRLLGVLDVDSPMLNRFSRDDEEGLRGVVDIVVRSCQWPAAD